MTKSATEVMQEIVFAAVVDAVVALKDSSKGVPNSLLRDLNAIHANTAFADLPEALQATIPASVRAAFTRLLKEGYSVSPGRPAQPPRPPRPDTTQRRPDTQRRGPRPGGGPGRPGGGSGSGGSGGGRSGPGPGRGPAGKPGPRKG